MENRSLIQRAQQIRKNDKIIIPIKLLPGISHSRIYADQPCSTNIFGQNSRIIVGHKDMKSQEYPICHFQLMQALASELAGMPAQIQGHHYLYKSFGSFELLIQFKGQEFRAVLDGRDNIFLIEKKVSSDWKEIASKSIDMKNIERIVSFICDGLKSS